MGDILTLAKKIERAMRNGTGFNVTQDEAAAMIENDIVDAVYIAKMRRLKAQCLVKQAPTSSAPTGSTGAVTAPPPRSGKLPPTSPEAGRSHIEALGFGT